MKLDIDIKKRVVYRIGAEIFNLLEADDLKIMMDNNLIIFDVFKKHMPEVIEWGKKNGRGKGVSTRYVSKLLVSENIQEFITKYLPKFQPLFEERPSSMEWVQKQVEHLLTNVWHI